MGAITDENARDVQVDFSFLPAGTSFAATVYRDGKTAHYRKDPYSLTIETMTITPETNLTFHLAPGGGLAISLMKKQHRNSNCGHRSNTNHAATFVVVFSGTQMTTHGR